ncbi:MAG TPA: TspO/MBR family protein [Acidimicrobiales bacterium]|nr:TspO/MBR family protein [Acidimicrobiales bacterium]
MAAIPSKLRTGPVPGVAGSLLAAGVGGLGARKAPAVYGRLDKPRWAPPASLFGPVWTALYAAMAVSLWRARRADPDRSGGLAALHAGQLALNAAWPWAFFSARSRPASLGVIAALDVAVAAEVVVAGRRDRVAAALLVPYLGWSLFATALTVAVGDPGRVPQG